MQTRPLWQRRIEDLWRQRSVLWLSGVRRVGKTTLCRSLPDIEYFDCELPRTRRLMDDPEGFLESLEGRRVVLDEIHRLDNPSELLKIAADHFPTSRILATGSSTLGAASKFRDTLAGRKAELWLTPATSADTQAFHTPDLETRLHRGGLPPFLLAESLAERDFQEWMDAYWAKDILELFRLERRHSFLRFVELLLAASGGIFEATRYARPCEVSRTTISNYLAVLESTFVAHVVRPFSTGKSAEIVSAPKVYGFDTGFVSYYRGWSMLRREDLGQLWEHYVLNELHAHFQHRQIQYWRDKQGHELDFVLTRRGGPPVAIECKWSADEFDPSALTVFRRKYPEGENFLVTQDVPRVTRRRYKGMPVVVTHLAGLIERLG
ncbi:ATP-binding protein [Algiphilus sp. W345]|uniref:ATP-binding protein n=1 Tax=Banduia mediterranea TaxID=3075609 RepID=A0ABU2WKN9_9GAMM|nr:ATP-binding protein [Algiphilus sp. W345]MDT0498085.1 ATP-binding protein [Algiphilus sp. W345]